MSPGILGISDGLGEVSWKQALRTSARIDSITGVLSISDSNSSSAILTLLVDSLENDVFLLSDGNIRS